MTASRIPQTSHRAAVDQATHAAGALGRFVEQSASFEPASVGPRLSQLLGQYRDHAMADAMWTADGSAARRAIYGAMNTLASRFPGALVAPIAGPARPLAVMNAEAQYSEAAFEGADASGAARRVLELCGGLENAYLGAQMASFYRQRAS